MAIQLHRPSIFYTQVRLGLNGVPFRIYKFRTMPNGCEPNGAVYPVPNDTRATRIGRFLRRHGLDELPQIINILKGDMALVGPRPERPEIYDSYYPANWERRLAVKPGLFGYAQYMGAKNPHEKLAWDNNYISYKQSGAWNWWDDLRIAAGCLWKAMKGRW